MEQREHLDSLSPGTAATAPGHVPSSGVVGGTTTMTLPQLWLADPSLWFIQVENKFRIHRITSEVRKHELLVEALPPQAMAEIRDILVGPPGDTPYTTVKQALLHRLVPPKHRRIQQLLCNEELGDRRPTQFLRHLQHLLGDHPKHPYYVSCFYSVFHLPCEWLLSQLRISRCRSWQKWPMT